MRDLEQLQQAFQAYLLTTAPSIKTDVVSDKVEASVRLDIYRSAYRLRLHDALLSDYPILAKLMGEKHFTQLMEAYIDAQPSRFRSLRDYGKALPTFMDDMKIVADKPWLVEVARLEWALIDSFDANDETVITLEDIAALPPKKWPKLRFKLHPTCQLLIMQWNSVSVWEGFKQRKVIKPKRGYETWLLWRKSLEVQFALLKPDAAFMLAAFARNQDFSEVCMGLCQWVTLEQVGMHAATLLKRFIVDGVFAKLVTK